jgi:hypothetical protein
MAETLPALHTTVLYSDHLPASPSCHVRLPTPPPHQTLPLSSARIMSLQTSQYMNVRRSVEEHKTRIYEVIQIGDLCALFCILIWRKGEPEHWLYHNGRES